MPEDERLRLKAIAERIARIRAWTEAMDESIFLADDMARDAVAMSPLVVGETSRRRLEGTKAGAPEIPWPAITSLRNRIAHGYETVDHRLVWQIIRRDLPALGSAIDRLLTEF